MEQNKIDEEVNKMPEPQTLDYNQTVKFTDEFVNDMYEALNTFAYTEVHKIFKTVEQLKDNMPINFANEIIAKIASFPYNKVVKLMTKFENDQSQYVIVNEIVNNTSNK